MRNHVPLARSSWLSFFNCPDCLCLSLARASFVVAVRILAFLLLFFKKKTLRTDEERKERRKKKRE